MEEVERLVNMGFEQNKVVSALKKFDNEEGALNYLLESEALTPATRLEPLNPNERQRVPETPVGLQNVGNTCYVNSLIQSYFMIPYFYSFIMRLSSSDKLVKEFQRAFGLLAASCKKYINPSALIREFKDEHGNKVALGEQKDIGEFNLLIIEGLTSSLEEKGNSEMFLTSSGVKIEENPVSRIFYGIQRQVLTTEEEDHSKVRFKSDVMVGQIMLDVKYRELYNAWENSFNTLVENYKTPRDFTNRAYLSLSFTKLPKILTFQLNRYVFEEKKLKKLHDKFNFHKKIYPDRFVHANRSTKRTIQKKYQVLRQELEGYESLLDRFLNYQSSGTSLEHILWLCIEFLQSSGCEDLEYPVQHRPDLAMGLSAISHLHEFIAGKTTSIMDKIREIKSEIQSLFSIPELKQCKYHLHSILIHEGEADVGHYYCFIHDYFSKKWWKFNDLDVSEVDENYVFKNSLGGGSGRGSAYGLLYISDDMLMKENAEIPRSLDIGITSNFYSSLLPDSIKAYVNEHNANENRVLAGWVTYQEIENILNLYKNKYNLMYKEYTKLQGKTRTSEILKTSLRNFGLYLTHHQLPKLAKWYIIDTNVQELTGGRKTLTSFLADKSLYMKFKESIGHKFNENTIIDLSTEEQTVMARHFSFYSNSLKSIMLLNHAVICIINSEFLNGLQVLVYIQSIQQTENALFIDQTKAFHTILLLRIISLCLHEFISGAIEQGMLWLELIANGCILFLEPRDAYFKQFYHLIQQLSVKTRQENTMSIDNQRKIGNILEEITDRRVAISTSEHDARFAQLVSECDSMDFYKWSDPSDQDTIIEKYFTNAGNMQEILKSWIDRYRQIPERTTPFSYNEWITLDLEN